MENLTHVVFILDKSGSMHPYTNDTIGGFNSYLKKEKEDPEKDSIVSLYIFDDEVEKVFESVNIENVKDLTDKEYVAGGSTALFDAIGKAIANTEKVNNYLKVQGTLFIIITDGYENASREYNYRNIKSIIEKKKENDKWNFIFLGANIVAEDFAESIGIDRDMAVTFKINSDNIDRNFNTLHSLSTHVRHSNRNCEDVDVHCMCELLSDIRDED